MRLGQTDASQNPTSSTLRRSYDLLAEGFGPGFNGPLVLAVDLSATTNDEAALAAISECGEGRPGCGRGGPAGRRAERRCRRDPGDADDRAAGRSDDAARQPTPRRGVAAGRRLAPTRHVYVGGQTAVFIDLSERIAEPPAAVHRVRRRPVVHPADDRVPLDPRADQGRGDEPALDRRRLRRRSSLVFQKGWGAACSASTSRCRSSASSRCSCSRSCSGSRWTTRCSSSAASARSTTTATTTPSR